MKTLPALLLLTASLCCSPVNRASEDMPMSINEGRGGGTVSIDIRRKRESVKEAGAESKLETLFRELGGQGKIKVRRKGESGEFEYVGTLDASDLVVDQIEETLASRWGGGEFHLQAKLKEDHLGTAEVRIDPKVFPPKKREGEAAAPAAAAPLDPLSHPIVRELIQAMRTNSENRITDNQSFTQLMMQQQNLNHERMLRMLELQRPAALGAPSGSGVNFIQQAKDVFSVVKEARELVPGGGATSAADDRRTLVERVIERPLEHAVDRVVDKFFKDEEQPQKQQQQPSSAAPQKQIAQTATPTAAAPPTPSGPARPPAGVKPLSPEQARAAIARSKAAGGVGPTPAAPVVKTTEKA